MATKIIGRTAFNNKGTALVPNEMGPPDTTFKGRGALPDGKLSKERFPGPTADISGSNRRGAKSAHGAGSGSGTVFKSRTGFGNGK